MSARYHVLCSDELMDSPDLQWPTCLRPIERGSPGPGPFPGSHWWLFEDDDAPGDLNGKQVELAIGTLGGVTIIERKPA